MTTNFLFPPFVPAIYPAFAVEEARGMFSVKFNLSGLNNIEDIKHIQIKITEQSNGQSIYNELDGIYYFAWDNKFLLNTNTQDCQVNFTDLNFEAGKIYRIQVRFGNNNLWEEENVSFTEWKKQSIENQSFSDWSSVSVVKAINKPELKILNDGNVDNELTETVETLNSPNFIGKVVFDNISKESQDKYRFELYKDEVLISDSGWLSHVEGNDNYRFDYSLENRQYYVVKYSITSVNGYVGEIEYKFLAIQDLLEPIKNIDISIDDKSEFALENGCFRILLDSKSNLIVGNYVITRTDSKSNYTKWEDIRFLEFFQESLFNHVAYIDYTIEYGVGYKYAISAVNALGLRTANKEEIGTPVHYSYFDSCYLLKQKQLPLRFDVQLSSFKKTVLAAKQDTLGSQYPIINRNGQSYYAEFPLNGLISMDMDKYNTFLNVGQTTDEITRRENTNKSTISPEKRYYMERLFREEVEKFLNDGTPKLFRSPTEGNFIIGLLNVSLTPKQELGRMIYSFSATAYELYDCSLSNLNSLNIITIGNYGQGHDQGKEILRPGQLNFYVENYALMTNDERKNYQSYLKELPSKNLADVIKKQIEEESLAQNTGYFYSVNDIKYIWFEPNIFSNSWIGQKGIGLKIDNQEIYLGKNQVYYFNNNPKTIKLIEPENWIDTGDSTTSQNLIPYWYPMISFVAGCSAIETGALSVKSVESKLLISQVIGTFTEDKELIKSMEFDSLRFQGELPADFKYYTSLDVVSVIEEQVRKDLGRYLTSQDETPNENYFDSYDEVNDLWYHENQAYNLTYLDGATIQAAPGTIFYCNDNNEKVIGNSGSYTISDTISSLKFKNTTYAIVTFQTTATIRYLEGVE